ncbi:MAG: hypothetical protein ACI4K7_10500 [Oscillospiraceae bacterium]
MKKTAVTAVLIIIIGLFSGIFCSAEENDEGYDGIDPGELYSSLGIDDSGIYSAVPDEAGEILSENGVTMDDAGEFTEISFGEVISYILEKFGEKLKSPMKTLGMVIAAALLSSAVSSFSETVPDSRLKTVYSMVSVMVTAAVVAVPVSECLNNIAATIKAGGVFMLAYVPVYAGIAASSGAVTSAAVYNMTIIGAAEGAVQLASNIMLPLMSSCMALGIADGINTQYSLGSITALINKCCTFLIIAVMTIFTGMTSLQSSLGTAADSIGVKAAKLAVSNFIPVVGGALSDTYGTVRSCLGLLRSAAGIYGIAAIALTVLPPALEAAALYLAVNIGCAVSEILGQDRLVKLLKNTSSVIGMALGILLCFGVMLIISTGILMVQNPS